MLKYIGIYMAPLELLMKPKLAQKLDAEFTPRQNLQFAHCAFTKVIKLILMLYWIYHLKTTHLQGLLNGLSLPELPPIYFHRWALFDQMIKISENNRPFMNSEFEGEAFKYLIKSFKKGYGFDTFEGLPEDWHYRKAGSYSSEGKIPKVEGGEFIKGNFNDTLPDFFFCSQTNGLNKLWCRFILSTICVLNFAQSVIDKDTILIFDEFG